MLSYYTKYSIGTKKKDTKDNGTFYSRTSQLCDYVISIKNKLVEKLLDGNDYIEKKGKESSQNLLNSKIREQTKTEKKPDGYTLRDFFKHCIEKLPNLYEKFEKIDDQTKTD